MSSASPVCFWLSLLFICFIYLTSIFTAIEIKQFIGILNFNADFFKCRQPILNIAYIISFIFVLYILNPITLFLANVYGANSKIPLFVNDIADILIFLVFFPRAWILWFDRQFVDNLKNWLWRREINIQDSNFLIRHRKHLNSPHVLVYSFYLLLVAPIFTLLHILPYYNIIPLYCHVMRVGLLLILLSLTTVVVHKISAVSDEWSIRAELLSSVKTTGIAYAFSHIFYIIIKEIWFDEHWALLIELLFVCIADLFVVYYACHWTRTKYVFIQKVNFLLHHLKHDNRGHKRKSSYASFLPTRVQFQDIMDHRIGVEAFCNHLVKEFGLESMLFLLEVTQFKAIIRRLSNGTMPDNVPELCDWHTTTHDMNDKHVLSAAFILNVSWLPIDPRMFSFAPHQIALHLYDKYIEESADLCINISFGIRKEIYRYFQQLSRDQNNASVQKIKINIDGIIETAANDQGFDETDSLARLYRVYDSAFTEVWRLIQTDSFIRFRGTEEFRRLVSALFPTEAAIANDELVQMVDEAIKKERNEMKQLKKQQQELEKRISTPLGLVLQNKLSFPKILTPKFNDINVMSMSDTINSTGSRLQNTINANNTIMNESNSSIQYESMFTQSMVTATTSMVNCDEMISRAPSTNPQLQTFGTTIIHIMPNPMDTITPNITSELELPTLHYQQHSLSFLKGDTSHTTTNNDRPQLHFAHSL